MYKLSGFEPGSLKLVSATFYCSHLFETQKPLIVAIIWWLFYSF